MLFLDAARLRPLCPLILLAAGGPSFAIVSSPCLGCDAALTGRCNSLPGKLAALGLEIKNVLYLLRNLDVRAKPRPPGSQVSCHLLGTLRLFTLTAQPSHQAPPCHFPRSLSVPVLQMYGKLKYDAYDDGL